MFHVTQLNELSHIAIEKNNLMKYDNFLLSLQKDI